MGFNIGKTIKQVGEVVMPWSAKQPKSPELSLPSVPKFEMKKTSDFMTNDPRIEIGGANSIARRFGSMRERASQQSNASLQSGTDAIKRRFTSQGGAGSGAQIKAEMMMRDNAERQKNDAMAQLSEQEEAAQMAHDSAQADMDFKQRVFSFERGSKMHELDLAERQQQQDAVATEINARIAKEQAKPPKEGLISRMLGGIL